MPGPARAPFTKDNQPPRESKSAGKDVAKEIRDIIAARRQEVLDAQFKRALDNEHPQGHAAAKDLLDRIAPVKQEIDATVAASHVIRAPAKAAGVADWLADHAPGANE